MAAEGICTVIPARTKNDLEGQWVDPHDTTPESSEESAKAQPVWPFLSRLITVKRLEKQACDLEQKIEHLHAVPIVTEENLEGQRSIWWRQIYMLVEIRKANTNQLINEGTPQSCCYPRLVLREQLDPHFGTALILCKDGSGLLYTKDWINIYVEPLKFIQVITGFSNLKHCQIGWDPGMQVYDPESGGVFVSYLVGDETRFLKLNLANTPWEIDIPSQVKGERERIISLAALSISPFKILCGRATLVWEAIRRATPFNANEIFVPKRHWHPYKRVQDGEEVPSSHMNDGDGYPLWGGLIYSDEDIQTTGGNGGSTLENIRHGLKMDPSTAEARSRKRVRSDGVSVTVNRASRPFLYVEPKVLVHTQAIHTYTGRPLRHFKDLNELLRVIRDVVKEHRHLYYDDLVLHRDISIENIIIMARDYETEGQLIGFDHAKVASSRTARKTYNVSPERIERLKSIIGWQFVLDDEAIKQFLTYLSVDTLSEIATSMMYIWEVTEFRKNFFSLDITHQITPADLGWDYEVKDSPDFSTHVDKDGSRIGTLPFMSIEVLNMGPVHSPPSDYKKWCHDAVHDIESLFWVLAFICLVREGPGINMHRRELLKSDPRSRVLETILRDYFHYPRRNAILCNRMNLFTILPNMDSNILANFHDYFEPLKQLMNQWWHIMVLAYKYRRFEYYTIHDQVLCILDKAIENLPNHQLGNDDGREKKQRRRSEDRIFAMNA